MRGLKADLQRILVWPVKCKQQVVFRFAIFGALWASVGFAAEVPHWQRIVQEVLHRAEAPEPAAAESALSAKAEHQLHPEVARFAAYFRGRGAAGFAAGNRKLAPWREMIARIFTEEGVPERLLWLGYVESGWDPSARSSKDALGMWQLMDPTARRFGLQRGGVEQRTDVPMATRAAARYLRWLYARFGDWNLALAAYNAGEGRVEQAMHRSGKRNFWELAAWLPAETAAYVPAVLGAMAAGDGAAHVEPKEAAKANGARIVRAGITLAP